MEELRPASRGKSLELQRQVESNDQRFFFYLEEVLDAVRCLNPSVSVTGGEPSKDPRLPRILRVLRAWDGRKRTVTTNGSGLLDRREGERVIDWICGSGVEHLNISRAHPDNERNAGIMRYRDSLNIEGLREVVRTTRDSGTRIRLSCVLLKNAIHSLEDVLTYLDFAARLGVENVIFRQLMKTDPRSVVPSDVVRYSNRQRAHLEPLLDRIGEDVRFQFQRQVMGYYYYVEVWKYENMDVVFEEADLAQLERTKKTLPGVVQELVFHPNAKLASTWQSWDGVLGPPFSAGPAKAPSGVNSHYESPVSGGR